MLLRTEGMRESCIATNTICTMALKAGAAAGLTLQELGQVFQRPFPPGHPKHASNPSVLENMIVAAAELSGIQYHTTTGTFPPSAAAATSDDASASSPKQNEPVLRYSSGNKDVANAEKRIFGDHPPPR